jgi:hypothetical protein
MQQLSDDLGLQEAQMPSLQLRKPSGTFTGAENKKNV